MDDGSNDPPDAVIASFAADLRIQLVVVPHNRGPAHARNTGAQHATGQYLVFLDDDCIPLPNWLSALHARFVEHPEALIGGVLTNGAPNSLGAEASQQLANFLYRYYNANHDRAAWFMSANIACPRDAFLALGGFDTSFPLAAAEDRDLCDRWREAGMPLVMAPGAIIRHMRTMNVAQYWRQHRTYGRGAHHLHLARAKRHVALPKREPLAFYLQLLMAPLSAPLSWRTPLLMALMFVSQVAYISGYLAERNRTAAT